MGVFYIDFEHAKDMFQVCKRLQGSMRKCMLPTTFPGVRLKTLSLGFKGGVPAK